MRLRNILFLSFTILVTGFFTSCRHSYEVWLDDLEIKKYSQDISSPLPVNPGSGDTIKIGDQKFNRGIGVKFVSALSFFPNGKAKRFTASAGPGMNAPDPTPVKFYVIGDRKILFESRIMGRGEPPEDIDVSLEGIRGVGLLVVKAGEIRQRSVSWWADAKFIMLEDKGLQPVMDSEKKYILTPSPGDTPEIHSAKVFGATPGNPFFYTIAATGIHPLHYSARHLPPGLTLDPVTGIITGRINRRGTWQVRLKVQNASGEDEQALTIISGDTIALTPPMGWNGWNSWARDIDREKVISSADAMVNSGLAGFGWTYINIDDTWEGQRGGLYNGIQPNEKFRDFAEMVDYIHSLGLKAGLYSTPWISTYAGYTGCSSPFSEGYFPDSVRENHREYRYVGRYTFEPEDARQMAAWGIDFLKYDWHLTLPPAERMLDALRHSGRDIVYSLSNSAPFDQAAQWAETANMWRTGGDIRDTWLSLYSSAFSIDKWAPFAGPGHWNDPDMLVLGNVSTGMDLHPTRLTPDEQYSHMSIYCLLSAPLILGCPLESLDPFTINLLTNDEVLEIDQDPLGKPARLKKNENGVQIWVKTMEDGSYAAGIFNTAEYGNTPDSFFRWGDEKPLEFTFDPASVGLTGKWRFRDVWRQKDLDEGNPAPTFTIPFHGVILLKMISIKDATK